MEHSGLSGQLCAWGGLTPPRLWYPEGVRITYRFEFPDGAHREFTLDPERPRSADQPDWTALDVYQCPNCPLDGGARCPAAVDLAEVVQAFDAPLMSIDEVSVRVISHNREVVWSGPVQGALRSLIGLVMPWSECPILGRLRTSARFHLPFSDRRETVYRMVSSYLLEQYFVAREGGEADWELDGLKHLYQELQTVNIAFAGRLRTATRGDATVNAIASLFSLATLVSMSLDADLKVLRSQLEA